MKNYWCFYTKKPNSFFIFNKAICFNINMDRKIYSSFFLSKQAQKKSFAILIDPDNLSLEEASEIINIATSAYVDYFFVGGSIITDINHFHELISFFKKNTRIPVVIFPGNSSQVSPQADAILLLSLISGRNPDLLIGQHVQAAPLLKRSKLEVIPTAYMLIDGGSPTAVTYMSNTMPIPAHKSEIAVCTAMAGELLGLKLLYMETGSGAQNSPPYDMIQKVRNSVDIPMIVGGGIRDVETVKKVLNAGADTIVIGNHIEKDKKFIKKVGEIMKEINLF